MTRCSPTCLFFRWHYLQILSRVGQSRTWWLCFKVHCESRDGFFHGNVLSHMLISLSLDGACVSVLRSVEHVQWIFCPMLVIPLGLLYLAAQVFIQALCESSAICSVLLCSAERADKTQLKKRKERAMPCERLKVSSIGPSFRAQGAHLESLFEVTTLGTWEGVFDTETGLFSSRLLQRHQSVWVCVWSGIIHSRFENRVSHYNEVRSWLCGEDMACFDTGLVLYSSYLCHVCIILTQPSRVYVCSGSLWDIDAKSPAGTG